MNDCPFCNPTTIAKQKIYETETEFVIYNLHKTNKGRCLVIPKRHVGNIRELSDLEMASLIKTVSFVSEKLKASLHPVGINYGFNEGEAAGQVVSHFHFHILPRFKDDSVLQYHLFHSNPKLKENWNEIEMVELVKEFRSIFEQ